MYVGHTLFTAIKKKKTGTHCEGSLCGPWLNIGFCSSYIDFSSMLTLPLVPHKQHYPPHTKAPSFGWSQWCIKWTNHTKQQRTSTWRQKGKMKPYYQYKSSKWWREWLENFWLTVLWQCHKLPCVWETAFDRIYYYFTFVPLGTQVPLRMFGRKLLRGSAMENFCINMGHIDKVMEGGTVLQELPDMQAEGARKQGDQCDFTHVFLPQKVSSRCHPCSALSS